MTCPKCGHEQRGLIECERCGVIFSKIRLEDDLPPESFSGHHFPAPIENLVGNTKLLLIDQHQRGWLEILTDWEVANEYSIQDGAGRIRGFIVEQGRGFGAALKRSLLGSHRPLHLVVFSPSEREVVIELTRPFFFFLSEMEVLSADRRIGSIVRRFALRTRYELYDERERLFATIVRPLMNIWTFELVDASGKPRGEIAKKWSGLGQEWFTDADKFRVMFDADDWTLEQKSVVLAAAMAIDFDFFENNQKR